MRGARGKLRGGSRGILRSPLAPTAPAFEGGSLAIEQKPQALSSSGLYGVHALALMCVRILRTNGAAHRRLSSPERRLSVVADLEHILAGSACEDGVSSVVDNRFELRFLVIAPVHTEGDGFVRSAQIVPVF